MLIVWGAAVVVALVVLGSVGYGVAGAFGRFTRELEAAQRDVQPLLAQTRSAPPPASE